MEKYDIKPLQGAGLGLRTQHCQTIFKTKPDIPWFELLTENYMSSDGPALIHAQRIRENYPVTLHGVGMSLGSVDPLNSEYLTRLKNLARRLEPSYISDHLAWVSTEGKYTHDLLPLPYTKEALQHVSERIQQVQDFLGRQLLIENPSSYLTFKSTEMHEWEFIKSVLDTAGCKLLLDVNNLYVSAFNHNFDPLEYISALPADSVKEIHLAGYETKEGYLFDTHGHEVHQPVWSLYQASLAKFGPVPTLIEWDTDIPPFKILFAQAKRAQLLLDQATG
ncbi:MAG: DUF692 domain-containing protein [Gammaproteobacteria bacterium]|nr:DUF692 domain-containing protein [Gammaproteobacteria bacterium]